MLNIIDRFHSEALMESARNVTAWKDFAMEASRYICYSQLGRMALMLWVFAIVHSLSDSFFFEIKIGVATINGYEGNTLVLVPSSLLRLLILNLCLKGCNLN